MTQHPHPADNPPMTDLRIEVTRENAQCPQGNQWTQPVISIYPPTPWMGAIAVPCRPDGTILLVRMYRHVLGGYAWELPQGRADATDADEVANAAREMLEETGYAPAAPGRLIGWVHPMTGLLRHRAAVVRFDVAADATPGPVDTEAESSAWFTREQIAAMIADGDIVCGGTLGPLAMVLIGRAA